MKSPAKLCFGTAGVPLSSISRDSVTGMRRVKELGLDNMELEFVRGVRMGLDKAVEVKRAKGDVILTAHAPYYVNLSSLEKPKVEASKKRILDTARVAKACSAWSICFHAGYYMKQNASSVYVQVKQQVREIVDALKREGNDIWVRPETTGKATQFGSLNELLKLSSEFENVQPCIDFSHLHARSIGEYNSREEFDQVLSDVESALGKDGLRNMHIHVSGIAYGDKGERNHLLLEESDFNYVDLLRALKAFDARGVVVCESPNIEGDALLLKNTYDSL